MIPSTDMPKIHIGKNIKRFRNMMEIKQESLASELEKRTGEVWNQKRVSWLEDKETVPSDLLAHVADALKLPVKAIENFSEEAAYNIIGNIVTTVNDNATGQIFQFNPTINPVEKWIEAIEEIKALNAEISKQKDEQIAILKQWLEEKKK